MVKVKTRYALERASKSIPGCFVNKWSDQGLFTRRKKNQNNARLFVL